MAKFNLNPNPTFQAPVVIPIPGTMGTSITLTFKHKTKTALDAYLEGVEKRDDFEVIEDIVANWDLEDEFNPDNLRRLLDSYPGAGAAIVTVYLKQLSKGKLGN